MCTGLASLRASNQQPTGVFPKTFFVSDEDLDKWEGSEACHSIRKATVHSDMLPKILGCEHANVEHDEAYELRLKSEAVGATDR
jgi:hypothetical protein